jgi:hypothetical protein
VQRNISREVLQVLPPPVQRIQDIIQLRPRPDRHLGQASQWAKQHQQQGGQSHKHSSIGKDTQGKPPSVSGRPYQKFSAYRKGSPEENLHRFNRRKT